MALNRGGALAHDQTVVSAGNDGGFNRSTHLSWRRVPSPPSLMRPLAVSIYNLPPRVGQSDAAPLKRASAGSPLEFNHRMANAALDAAAPPS
jgi:hypothetical protein